jgi:two-component system CheB/CheR fusion protein
MTSEETLGHELFQLKDGLWNIAELRKILEAVLANGGTSDAYMVERDVSGVGRRRVEINISRLLGKAGTTQMILLSMEINP